MRSKFDSRFLSLFSLEPIANFTAILLGVILMLSAASAKADDGSFDTARLEALLEMSPVTKRPVDSVNELVPLSPSELRSNCTFVYDSRSPFRDSISPIYPRVILFTADARFVLTFTTDPERPGLDLLETLSFDDHEAKFELRSYLLPAANRRAWRPSAAAANCASCHGADPRPIYDSYPLWPGFYGSTNSPGRVLAWSTTARNDVANRHPMDAAVASSTSSGRRTTFVSAKSMATRSAKEPGRTETWYRFGQPGHRHHQWHSRSNAESRGVALRGDRTFRRWWLEPT
jgi:hypothetical protein